jgi:hypothetical protein
VSGLSFKDLATGGVDGGDNACLTPAMTFDATRGAAAGTAGSGTVGSGTVGSVIVGSAVVGSVVVGSTTVGSVVVGLVVVGSTANMQGPVTSGCSGAVAANLIIGEAVVVCKACWR